MKRGRHERDEKGKGRGKPDKPDKPEPPKPHPKDRLDDLLARQSYTLVGKGKLFEGDEIPTALGYKCHADIDQKGYRTRWVSPWQR